MLLKLFAYEWLIKFTVDYVLSINHCAFSEIVSKQENNLQIILRCNENF